MTKKEAFDYLKGTKVVLKTEDDYDLIVENIRNQQCVTMGDIRALCEMGIPAVNICVKAVLADNFLKELDKFVNV